MPPGQSVGKISKRFLLHNCVSFIPVLEDNKVFAAKSVIVLIVCVLCHKCVSQKANGDAMTIILHELVMNLDDINSIRVVKNFSLVENGFGLFNPLDLSIMAISD